MSRRQGPDQGVTEGAADAQAPYLNAACTACPAGKLAHAGATSVLSCRSACSPGQVPLLP